MTTSSEHLSSPLQHSVVCLVSVFSQKTEFYTENKKIYLSLIQKGFLVTHNFKTFRHKYKLSSCRDEDCFALTVLPEAPTPNPTYFYYILQATKKEAHFLARVYSNLFPGRSSLQMESVLGTRLASTDLDPRL